MRKVAASAFSPSWMGLLHSIIPRDLSNGCFSPMGRIKDRGGMRWNAEGGTTKCLADRKLSEEERHWERHVLVGSGEKT